MKMRVGQHGGPLPFEAIIEFGEPIVYFLYFLHGPQEGRFLQQRKAFFATEPGLRRNDPLVTDDGGEGEEEEEEQERG
jgi:hypothetical protein